jgi:hypothetical protein
LIHSCDYYTAQQPRNHNLKYSTYVLYVFEKCYNVSSTEKSAC